MKPTELVMAGIAAGAIIAACGDDTRRVTKEEFTDQAVDEVMPHFERQLGQLRGLDPPLDDEELIAGLPDDHDAALAESAELVEAAAGGDEAAMATLESDDPFADVDRRMRQYGMTDCGADG